jgi:NitT/TauT family transport system permease protein
MKYTYLPARFRIGNYGGVRTTRTSFLFNIAAFLIITSVFMLLAWGAHEMTDPISTLVSEPISLDPMNLFEYSLRTTLRMFIAMIISIIFSLIYATIAAKSSRAEQILIPLLDILQSVPILGYISFTVAGFLLLFPGSILGAECAAIFAIFSSQVWNLAFSFYQSLKTVPTELLDASTIFKMSSWQRFWRVELPFGIPSLIANMIVSMSSGWFFVVAAEVINVGSNSIILPGIGSYIFLALAQENVAAIMYAITAMVLVIIIYDQLILRTLIAWADKFRYETSVSCNPPKSWVFSLFQKNLAIKKIFFPLTYIANFIVYLPLFDRMGAGNERGLSYEPSGSSKRGDYIWYSILAVVSIVAFYHLFDFLDDVIGWSEVFRVCELVLITMLRVVILVILSSLLWVPVGIYIGFNPKLTAIMQPIAQFMAAFPANLLFPIAVIFITRYEANPNIWLSPLMIMGAQWYILFNVIVGSSSFPNDLREVTKNLNIKGLLWWRKVMLPAIVPYFVTGAITASGGAWNASIVAEVVSWGDSKIVATGIGSYIAQMTVEADFHRIVLGIGVMSLFVALLNHFFWQPVYNYAANKYKF